MKLYTCHRKNLFSILALVKPARPSHIGSLWFTIILTQEEVDKVRSAGYSCVYTP